MSTELPDNSINPWTDKPRFFPTPRDAAQKAAQASAAARTKIATERQSKVLTLIAMGIRPATIARQLGVSERTVQRDLRERAADLASLEVVIESLDLDASDTLRTLTAMHDADLADLYHDVDRCPAECECQSNRDLVGALLPVRRWPMIWRRGLAAEVKIEPHMVRSQDGGNESWDRVGDKVTVKVLDRLKVLELAMRHKDVDALASQKQDVSVSVTVTPDEQREMAQAARRRAKVIDVTPTQDVVAESGSIT